MDGAPPPEEDFSQLSISERLAHKNWKARVNGYEALVKKFQATTSDNDPAFRPYTSNPDTLRKIVNDANAVAQEKGVECVIAFVKFAGETAARTREVVVPVLVDKCLGSTRAATKTKAIELILEYVEVENRAAAIVEDILPGLSAKQPKTVAGSVTALKEIIRLYGPIVCPPKSIFKAIPKIFAHSDKTVRAEGQLLVQSLYSYVGDAIQPAMAELKPVQVKEINEACEALKNEGKGPGSVKPERLTRAGAREKEAQELAGGEDEDEAPAEDEAPDPLQFMSEVDVVKKFPEGLYTNLLSSKWKDRKTALDDLAAVLTPLQKIQDAPAEFGELTRALAGRMTDANIMCVIAACQCLEGLAKGLGTPFARYREVVVKPMLERLKERKQNVQDAIGNALDAVFSTVTFPDILPDIMPQLLSKNPQVKEGSVKFLHRCMSATKVPPTTPQIKGLSEGLAGLLDDGAEPVRNEAAQALGVLMKIVGERAMNAVMETLDDIRKAKVKDSFDKAVVKCKVGAGGPPPRSATKAPEPPKKKGPASKAKPVGESAEAPKLTTKTPATKKPLGASKDSAAAAPKKPVPSGAPAAKGKAPPPATATDAFKFKHTPEDAEGRIAELIPDSIQTDFGDSNWKTRLAALEELTTWLEDGVVDDIDSELVVRFLMKKGAAEKNFQVSAKLYGAFQLLAERSSTFGRPSAALAIGHMVEKLGDMKLKKPAGDALMMFAEKTSLNFVLGQAYEPLSKQKAPKVLADATTWMKDALTEFGIAGLSLRPLIEHLKTALKNSNAAVRTSGTNCLVTLKIFAGAVIKDFLDDLNPQLMQTIEKEFENVEGQAAPVPTRTQADVSSVPQMNGKAKAGGGSDPMEELYPRVEIDRLLVGTPILANAKSDAWKSRKEALEQLQGLLEANRRFKSTMGDIGQVLKARIPDTNKAVQALALDVIARVASGMGKPFEKYTRLYVVPIATVLADQKAPIRASAKATLTAIATACEGPESLVSGLASALEAQNPLQRSELLSWLSEWFKDHPASPSMDLSPLAGPVVACLDDKSGDVRKGGQSVLPFLMPSVGYDALVKETNNLKPASRSTVLPILQNLKAAAAAKGESQTRAAPSKAQQAPSRPESVGPPESEPERAGSRIAPKSKLGLGLKRPAASAPSAAVAPTPTSRASPSGTPAPFTTSNPDAKRNRLAKDVGRWTIESSPVRKDLADLLQTQMELHVSRDISQSLFSHDHNAVNDWIAGMTVIVDCYNHTLAGDERYGPTSKDMRAILIANSDLALKYSCLRVHENQSNLVGKALDLVEAVVALLAEENYRLGDTEAACFLPTFIHKLGDAREPVRVRVQQLIQGLPKIYASSRIFQALLEYGVRSKNAKTRQGTLDELAHVLKRTGLSACEPAKAFPVVASIIGDKDAAVRKSALGVLSEAYTLEGDKIWSHVGLLNAKDKGQLEERLKRVPGPDKGPEHPLAAPPKSAIGRLSIGGTRSISPAPASASRLAMPMSPPRSASPALSQTSRTTSPAPGSGPGARLAGPGTTGIGRPKSMLPSRLGPTRGRPASIMQRPTPVTTHAEYEEQPKRYATNGHSTAPSISYSTETTEDITLVISNILSNDPGRSVEALKKIQKVMETTPDSGKADPKYQDLAEHTEGLIETVTLQMSHVFEHPDDIIDPANFRLAKHLIQTLNAFCDHPLFVQSLPVDIITSLLEELTLRLLVTDDSTDPKVKDLSKFINMILLRIFTTGRRISTFRSLFLLLLQIVKPFPVNGTSAESREAKVAELVLKCIWKLARNIPDDLKSQALDPVELFPAIEQFLQSMPPNDWRARATNKVPSGDMPLRTIKVIIQHVVAEFREDVYDQLSTAFDDPSATIVYPYVYRILNARPREDAAGSSHEPTNGRHTPPSSSRPQSVASSSRVVNGRGNSTASRPVSQRSATPPHADLDDQLNTIWMRVSEDSSGHKDALDDLHTFMKAHPEMRLKIEAMIEGTGGVFVRYIKRALASRQAEDELRSGVSRTNSTRTASTPLARRSTASSVAASGAQTPTSPRKSLALDDSETAVRIRALQDKFNYQGRGSMGSTIATTSSGHGHAHTDSRGSRTSSIYDIQSPEVQAHLRALRNRDSTG